MRKINSIGYGHLILLVIILFAVVFPLTLWLLSLLFRATILLLAAKISLMIGGLLGLTFAVFLAIEFRQDRKLNGYYDGIKNVKLNLDNGGYECPNCGNKNIRGIDKTCNVCGIRFRS